VRVARGLDAADTHIAANAARGDLAVVTQDIPLAALLVRKGVVTGGPKAFGPRDRQRFASTLDRALNQPLGARWTHRSPELSAVQAERSRGQTGPLDSGERTLGQYSPSPP
jgi:uncharacterized protein YaiI (UPF0178 family)